MKKTFFSLVIVLISSFVLHAQIQPNCDVDCGPAPTQPTPTPSGPTPQPVASLGSQSDQRGMGNVRSVPLTTGDAVTVQGSQSYTYSVPMFSVPGRAGFDLNLNLYYNSHIWVPAAQGLMMMGVDRDTPSPGFQLNFGFLEWNPASADPAGIITTSDGAKHRLLVVASNLVPNAPPPNNFTYSCANQICEYVSDDSSYYFVYRPLGTIDNLPCLGPSNCPAKDVTVVDKAGRVYLYQSFALNTNDLADEFVMRPYKITDPNGNFITIQYQDANSLNLRSVTDSLGHNIYFVYNPDGTLQCVNDGSTSCTGANGIFPTKSYTFQWGVPSIVFNYASAEVLIGSQLYGITSPFNMPMLTGVCRSDGTCVKFNYGDWGIVNDIQELSASGAKRYELSFDFPAAAAGTLTANPTYTHETETANGKTGTWTTSVSIDPTTQLMVSSSVTDPTGLTTTTSFSHNGPPDWKDGLPLQIQLIDNSELNPPCPPTLPCPPPSSKTLVTRNLTWIGDPSPASTDPTFQSVNRVNPHPQTITTIIDDGSQKQVSFAYDAASGNVTDQVETDFGATAPGPPLRETITAYKSTSNHILGLPTDIQVKDGSGKLLSHTAMAYDGSAVESVGSSVAGHDDVNFSAGSTAPRGNLTSVTSYPDPNSTAGGVTTTYTYDDLGNRITTVQGCCLKTAANFSSITDFAFPDSVVRDPGGPNAATTSFTYNGRGQIASETDMNGQLTQFGYDGEGRPTTVKTPDNVTVTTQYDDSNANLVIKTFNSVNPSSVAVHTADFLGHPLSDQVLSGGTVVSTVTYDNDLRGRPLKVSNPFAPSDTPVYTNTQYDLLGRVSSTTPPAVTAGVAQRPYTVQITGSQRLLTDPAGNQQKQFVNGLGQLVEVDMPGPAGGAFATAPLAVSGTELSVPSTSATNGATAGTASVTIGGTTDRSTTVVTHQATAASVTVVVGGANGTNTTTSTVCTGGPPSRLPLSCRTFTTNIADSGNMQFSVNVGGTVITSAQVPYSSSSSTITLAQGLVNAFPANSLVKVSYGGANSFTLTTVATGTAANSSFLATSIASSCVNSSTDTSSTVCNQGWTITPSQNFAGGTNQTTAPDSDKGNVTVSITANSVTYKKQSSYTSSSTPASIALDLYNQFNSDTAFNQVVRVTQPGTGAFASNQVGFTTVATGSGTSYALAIGSATTDANFASGSTSFPISDSGSTFTPGQNGTLYDKGTVTLTVSGFSSATTPTKQVSYGQGSNAPGVAAQLAAVVHNDPLFPLDASVPAGSSTITFSAREKGATGNGYVVTIKGASSLSTSFPTPSFASPAAQATLANGAEQTYSLAPGFAIVTRYTNDPRGMTLQVTKGTQTQTYAYDGLGRLTSVITPETRGQAVQYNYTDFNAVHQRIDPRLVPGTSTHITATYGYDTLGRVSGISYNDNLTSPVTYKYGAASAANNTGGRLASLSNNVESKAYQYDVMGRELQCLETIGTSPYTVGYSYFPDGMPKSITYPSSKVVNFSYDTLDRLTQVTLGSTQKIFSINPADYNAAGIPSKFSFGNNVVGQFGYNAQLQLTSLQYGLPSATPLLSLSYLYGDGLDNGQIQGINDNVVPERSTIYKYDPLGQLISAQTTDLTKANTWKLAFDYDAYGNRLNEIPLAGAGNMPGNSVAVDSSSNRITSSGVIYDAAGNMTSDGLDNYTFDAEGHLITTSPVPGLGGASASFGYGPDGARVNNNGTFMIYANGKPIAEYANGAAAGSPTVEYVNVGGNQVASVAGSSLTFNFADHLSTRVVADVNGTPTRTYGHFPYGETWYQTGTSSKWDFTSYERDLNSSGLDYANARFYSSRLGRFTALDVVLGSNRYAYGGNDPINMVDPSGQNATSAPGGAACTTNPFSGVLVPLCGPDQLGNDISHMCPSTFGSDDFGFSFSSGCSSFSFSFGITGLPFSDIGTVGGLTNTVHNLLAEYVNLDSCPSGQFECPSGGRPLFGTPNCDPMFCVQNETLKPQDWPVDPNSPCASNPLGCLNPNFGKGPCDAVLADLNFALRGATDGVTNPYDVDVFRDLFIGGAYSGIKNNPASFGQWLKGIDFEALAVGYGLGYMYDNLKGGSQLARNSLAIESQFGQRLSDCSRYGAVPGFSYYPWSGGYTKLEIRGLPFPNNDAGSESGKEYSLGISSGD